MAKVPSAPRGGNDRSSPAQSVTIGSDPIGQPKPQVTGQDRTAESSSERPTVDKELSILESQRIIMDRILQALGRIEKMGVNEVKRSTITSTTSQKSLEVQQRTLGESMQQMKLLKEQSKETRKENARKAQVDAQNLAKKGVDLMSEAVFSPGKMVDRLFFGATGQIGKLFGGMFGGKKPGEQAVNNPEVRQERKQMAKETAEAVAEVTQDVNEATFESMVIRNLTIENLSISKEAIASLMSSSMPGTGALTGLSGSAGGGGIIGSLIGEDTIKAMAVAGPAQAGALAQGGGVGTGLQSMSDDKEADVSDLNSAMLDFFTVPGKTPLGEFLESIVGGSGGKQEGEGGKKEKDKKTDWGAVLIAGIIATALVAIAKPLFEFLGPLIQPIADLISMVVNDFLKPLMPILVDVFKVILPLFAQILKSIWEEFLQPLLPILLNFLEKVIPPFADLIVAVLTVIKDVLVALKDPLIAMATAFVGVITQVLTSIKNVIVGIEDVVVTVLTTIADIVEAMKQPIIDLSTALLGFFTKMLSTPEVTTTARQIVELGGTVANTINTTLTAINGVISGVSGILNRIFNFIDTVLKNALSVISTVLNVIGSGIISLIGHFVWFTTFIGQGGLAPGGGDRATRMADYQKGSFIDTATEDNTAVRRMVFATDATAVKAVAYSNLAGSIDNAGNNRTGIDGRGSAVTQAQLTAEVNRVTTASRTLAGNTQPAVNYQNSTYNNNNNGGIHALDRL